MKLLRFLLRSPSKIGFELKVATEQKRGQKERQLQTVFLRRGEKAHRPVDVQHEAGLRGSFDFANEPMKFDFAKELSIALRRLITNGDVCFGRTEQNRLGERDVVSMQELLGCDVFELDEALLAFEVREESKVDLFTGEIKGGTDFFEDGLAIEFAGGGALLGGGTEDEITQLSGGMVGDGVKLATVHQKLGESLMHELSGGVAEELIDVVFEGAATAAFLIAKDFDELFRDVKPVGVLDVEIIGEDALSRVLDSHHFSGQHRSGSLRGILIVSNVYDIL